MKQSWYYWLLSDMYLSLMCAVQFFLTTFTSVRFVQMTLSSRVSDLQNYVFNDISERLVLTGFYIYFLCGANSSSPFPSVISGEDLISFIQLFTVQRALSSPSLQLTITKSDICYHHHTGSCEPACVQQSTNAGRASGWFKAEGAVLR